MATGNSVVSEYHRRAEECRLQAEKAKSRMIRRDGYNLLSDGNTSRPTQSDGERIEPPSSLSSDPQQFKLNPPQQTPGLNT